MPPVPPPRRWPTSAGTRSRRAGRTQHASAPRICRGRAGPLGQPMLEAQLPIMAREKARLLPPPNGVTRRRRRAVCLPADAKTTAERERESALKGAKRGVPIPRDPPCSSLTSSSLPVLLKLPLIPSAFAISSCVTCPLRTGDSMTRHGLV